MTPTQEEIQRVLEERHGKELQNAFSKARVAVCGLGGLGSHIAAALARAGIGRLHLIDFDRVELSNLHRQQYLLSQIGMNKTDATRQLLEQINPYLEIVTDTVRVTGERIPQLFSSDDIICEAFDRAEAKAMLVNGVLECCPEKFLVAASGMAGFGTANAIQTRRITKHFYLCGDGVSDVEAGIGLISARAMLCAAHQAQAVLRIAAGYLEV